MIFLFVLQIILSVLLIVIVLLQSSDEDALSGMGGSVGSSAILSHKSSVDLITKVTIALGCCLIFNSLALTVISKNRYSKNETIVEDYLKKQEKQEQPEDKNKIETESNRTETEDQKVPENKVESEGNNK